MGRTDTRATVEQIAALARGHGFHVTEHDHREHGPAHRFLMLDLDGNGQLIEVYFRRSETGYERFVKAFVHGGKNGDWGWTLTWVRGHIDWHPEGEHHRYEDEG